MVATDDPLVAMGVSKFLVVGYLGYYCFYRYQSAQVLVQLLRRLAARVDASNLEKSELMPGPCRLVPLAVAELVANLDFGSSAVVKGTAVANPIELR